MKKLLLVALIAVAMPVGALASRGDCKPKKSHHGKKGHGKDHGKDHGKKCPPKKGHGKRGRC